MWYECKDLLIKSYCGFPQEFQWNGMISTRLTDEVFRALYASLVAKCEQENKNFSRGRGAARFGFGNMNGHENSIKGMMLDSEEVVDHVIRHTYKQDKDGDKPIEELTEDDREDWVYKNLSGKYLYNKKREIDKGNRTVELSGLYETIYFKFIGYKDVYAFLESDAHNLSEDDKILQKDLLEDADEDNFISKFATRYLAFYYSYRQHTVKKFIVEIDHINNFRVRQKGFHLNQESAINSAGSMVNIGKSKIYEGNSVEMERCVMMNLATAKENDQKAYMNFFLFKGPMNLTEMQFIRGSMSAYSSYGYVFFGEIFLMRVLKQFTDKELLSPIFPKFGKLSKNVFDEFSEKITFIKRYLLLQRRTSRIPTTNEQNHRQLTAKRHRLDVLESMVGTWRIWALDKNNEIVQSILKIGNDYSCDLLVSVHNRVETQVCLLKVSQGANGNHLWISAHEEFGVEKKSEAIIEIVSSDNQMYSSGTAINLGIFSNVIGDTAIILTRVNANKEDALPRKLSGSLLRTEISKDKHHLMNAYKQLLDKIEERKKSYLEIELPPIEKLQDDISKDNVG